MSISQWPSFVVTPDGVVAKQAEHEKADVLFTDVDTSLNFHDGMLQLKTLNAHVRIRPFDRSFACNVA